MQPFENTYRIHLAQDCQVQKIKKAKFLKMEKSQIFFKNLLEFHGQFILIVANCFKKAKYGSFCLLKDQVAIMFQPSLYVV